AEGDPRGSLRAEPVDRRTAATPARPSRGRARTRRRRRRADATRAREHHEPLVPNVYSSELQETEDYRFARLGEAADGEQLGMSLYELAPGQGMVFHYHVQREELMIVLSGQLSLRTGDGWASLPEGEVVGFRRGERG